MGPKAILLTACILLPFWSSVLVRTAAWAILLQRNGIINQSLQFIGITEEPIRLLYTQGAVVIAMTHVLMPFMVLPIYGALRNIPSDYARAASICGAGPLRSFWEVTLPLAMPGILGGFILVFLTALGYFITPALLGSPQEMMIATLISQQMRGEPRAGRLPRALVGVLTLIVTVITLAFSKVFRFERDDGRPHMNARALLLERVCLCRFSRSSCCPSSSSCRCRSANPNYLHLPAGRLYAEVVPGLFRRCAVDGGNLVQPAHRGAHGPSTDAP